MREHTVAAAHCASVMLDKRASLEKAGEIVREAGRRNVELVCFPETFVPGFPYWINLYPPAEQHGIYLAYAEQSVDLSGKAVQTVVCGEEHPRRFIRQPAYFLRRARPYRAARRARRRSAPGRRP